MPTNAHDPFKGRRIEGRIKPTVHRSPENVRVFLKSAAAEAGSEEINRKDFF